jgi:hypothetical protein
MIVEKQICGTVEEALAALDQLDTTRRTAVSPALLPPTPDGNARDVVALRRELASAERQLREKAKREAERLAAAEHIAWREARDACFAYDVFRHNASERLEAIRAGEREKFCGERRLVEMALRDADRADAVYTVISFARLRDRLRYLRGGSEREAVVREALERGGVYTDACGGHHFQGIVR